MAEPLHLYPIQMKSIARVIETLDKMVKEEECFLGHKLPVVDGDGAYWGTLTDEIGGSYSFRVASEGEQDEYQKGFKGF